MHGERLLRWRKGKKGRKKVKPRTKYGCLEAKRHVGKGEEYADKHPQEGVANHSYEAKGLTRQQDFEMLGTPDEMRCALRMSAILGLLRYFHLPRRMRRAKK